jgi:predicted dehydrogenase
MGGNKGGAPPNKAGGTMKKPVTLGVVGCGYWGPNLIRNFRSLPDCALKVICDVNKGRLKHLGSLYPDVQTEMSFERVVADPGIDALVIATPVHLHHPMAKACLAAGKHAFIEKPMAASGKECEELVALAAEKKLTLMVGHTFLYSPPVRKVKEILNSGDIGHIRYIGSRRLNLGLFQKDINVVWDLAPHDLSIIMYLMGEVPQAVNCQGRANVTPGIEDVANMSLFFPSGGFATIQSSWLDPKKVREMTIVGTRRMIVYDDLEPLQKIKVFDMRVETPPHYDTFAQFQYSYHYGDMYAPYLKQEEPLKIECQHFLDCIRSGEKSISCGERGLEIVRILEAASESLKNQGSRVEIPGVRK